MRSTRAILIWTALGLAGAVLLAWAFPRAYPLAPQEWTFSEREARTVALEAMRDLGEPVADPYVVTSLRSEPQLERRLQTASAERGRDALAASRLAALQLVWDVMVYPPGAGPNDWAYRAFVSPGGEIVMLRRRDPEGADPELDDETARRLGAEYLLDRGFDPSALETPGEIQRNQLGSEHDLRLRLRSREAVLGPDFPYGLEVYYAGREVAGFGWWYEDPEPEAVESVLRQLQVFGVVSIVVLFLVLPVVAVAFLRAYHDGQLGVRRGVQILLLVLAAALVLVLINRHSMSAGNNIGFLSRRQITWVTAAFTLMFFYFAAAVLGLMSWSVGELFCRRSHSHKLASIDALFRGKWANATVARSALAGVAGGVLMAGLILALGVPFQSAGVWPATILLYRDALGNSLGWLSNLAASFAVVVPLFLFAAFLVPSWARDRLGPKASLAAAWLAVALVTPLVIALPMEWGWAMWALVAVIPVALFRWGDLLAVLLAGVVANVALVAAPGLFAGDPLLEVNAYAALLAAAAPLILSARHLLGDEEFVYAYDDVPPHVRRIAERERQRVELETAAEIQSSILPQLPAQLNGVEIASTYLPATEVGGDFYDVLALDDGRLAVAVGDVAGHGVSSGLVMSMAKSALAVQVTFDPEVEAVFRTLNRMVYQSARRRLLATLCYALVDPRRRELTYASAGHIYPYRISLGGQIHGLETASYPLGVRGAIDVRARTAKLYPSDAIFLCSDGLVEACPEESDEPFGFERLEASLRRHAGKPPREMRDAVLADVEAYVGERPREDDVTVLVLRLPAE